MDRNVISMITYTYKVTLTKFHKHDPSTAEIIDYCEGEIEGDLIMAVKGKVKNVNMELLAELVEKYEISEEEIAAIFTPTSKRGKVGIAISHKIPGTQGDYSSTGVEISAEYSDVTIEKTGIKKAVGILRDKLGAEMPELFNSTLEGLGLEPYFKENK